MGIGSARGDDRSVAAAEMAISSPLLEASIDGAHGVLLSIQGGSDLGLFEINEAAQLVANSAAPDANIIFGAVIDDALGDEVRVTVIAAGFDEAGMLRARPVGPALTRLGPDMAGSAASLVAASPVPNGAAGRDTGLSGHGFATGAAAEHQAAHYTAAPYTTAEPAVTGVTAPETARVAPVSLPEPDEPAAQHGEWAAAPLPESGSRDPAPNATPGAPAAPEATPAGTPRHRADPGAAARMFDAATTRRRSVVFEEDDELDVPDFLK
jgi:cell division protein FtsZ